MSTELAVASERGQSMAELMGVSSTPTTSTTPSISRLGMLHQPIMGEVELNGKMIRTEVVPVGAFTLKTGDDIIYSVVQLSVSLPNAINGNVGTVTPKKWRSLLCLTPSTVT